MFFCNLPTVCTSGAKQWANNKLFLRNIGINISGSGSIALEAGKADGGEIFIVADYDDVVGFRYYVAAIPGNGFGVFVW